MLRVYFRDERHGSIGVVANTTEDRLKPGADLCAQWTPTLHQGPDEDRHVTLASNGVMVRVSYSSRKDPMNGFSWRDYYVVIAYEHVQVEAFQTQAARPGHTWLARRLPGCDVRDVTWTLSACSGDGGRSAGSGS